MTHRSILARGALLLAAISLLSMSSAAHAQANAALLVKPWEANQTIEQSTEFYGFLGGHTQNGLGFEMDTVESEGRIRILPGHEASPRIGYDVTYLSTNTHQPGFPGQLLDASVAGGTFLSSNNGWITGLTLGLGYAGDQPFANGRGWYGRADFVVAKQFSDIDALGVGFDYDGHRLYAQDIPLPGFGWSHKIDPSLSMVIGVPVTSITWRPYDRLRIFADYILLTDFDIDVGYEFIPKWTAFGAVETRDDAFKIESIPGNGRLIYEQRRIEAGLRWQPNPHLIFSLAGGYGFDTNFRSGFDVRSTNAVLHASPEPYFRVGLDMKF
jgi:hypothetical protein